MTNRFNYNTRIVVVIAILALLLGLVIGGVFSILKENQDSGVVSVGMSDVTHGHQIVKGPVLLSEINYAKSCCKDKKNPNPGWAIDPQIGIY